MLMLMIRYGMQDTGFMIQDIDFRCRSAGIFPPSEHGITR